MVLKLDKVIIIVMFQNPCYYLFYSNTWKQVVKLFYRKPKSMENEKVLTYFNGVL